jgi:hypothetical protein
MLVHLIINKKVILIWSHEVEKAISASCNIIQNKSSHAAYAIVSNHDSVCGFSKNNPVY